MDEINPPRSSRKRGTSPDHQGDTSSAAGHTTPRKSRYAVDDAGDRIECSGKYCKSCSGALIADCVALCCCPCALLNLLTLAFVKVPWMVGRKCLGLGKSKGQKRKSKRKCSSIDDDDDHHHRQCEVEREEEERMPEISSDQMECVSARLEAERVWLELYQIGHLGFGRVSFSGMQSLGKAN
ncbi:hypothetical protein CerSpe_131660 [Prunus speciosa]